MKTRTLMIVLCLVALPAAGCIENLRDLTDGMKGDGAPTTEEDLDNATASDVDLVDDTNQTVVTTKEPVARITIYGANGALVFKSSFIGEDVASQLFVDRDVELKLSASDSEALEPGAQLVGFSWRVKGEALEGGLATVTLTEAGVFPLVLTVTDSNGRQDNQTIPLAVKPDPFDVVVELRTSQVAGASLVGVEDGTVPFDYSLKLAGKPAMLEKATFVASPSSTCDVGLEVRDAEGNVVAGPADKVWLGGKETAEATALPEGTLTISVYYPAAADTACTPQSDGVPIVVTLTFLEVVEGLEEGDGHGHNH